MMQFCTKLFAQIMKSTKGMSSIMVLKSSMTTRSFLSLSIGSVIFDKVLVNSFTVPSGGRYKATYSIGFWLGGLILTCRT